MSAHVLLHLVWKEIAGMWVKNRDSPLWQAIFTAFSLSTELPEPEQEDGEKQLPAKHPAENAAPVTPQNKKAPKSQLPDAQGLATPKKHATRPSRVQQSRPIAFGQPQEPATTLKSVGGMRRKCSVSDMMEKNAPRKRDGDTSLDLLALGSDDEDRVH